MKENLTDSYLIQKKSLFWTPVYLDFSAWIEHIPFAFWVVETFKPKTIVELGVHNGVSYFSFCQAVKALDIVTTCYGIDTWKGDEHSGFYEEEVFNKVTGYNNSEYSKFSTLIRSTFDDASDYFIDGSVDLLHIDGLHTYEAVKHDFEKWLPKLAADAVVVFHDINVRERNFGVFKVWEELKQQYNHFQFDFGHGLGILVIGKAVCSELEGLTNSSEHNGCYGYLRNFFSERGRFFKNSFDNSIALKQERENLEVQRNQLLHLVENQKMLELNYNQLQERYKLLEISNNQHNESYQVLGSDNSQLNENYKALEIQNNQLNESYNALVAEHEKLKQNLESFESESQKNQQYIAELSEKLNVARYSLNEIIKETADQKQTVEAANRTIQEQNKNINWYITTYEQRSIFGLIKEWLKLRRKKK